MNQTTLVNLALSKIGDRTVKAFGDATTKEGRLAKLHYEPTLKEVLRAHFWPWATTAKELERADTRTYLDVTGDLKMGSAPVRFGKLFDTGHVFEERTSYEEGGEDAGSVNWDGAWYLGRSSSGSWEADSDAIDPDGLEFLPVLPAHALETNLTGANNDLRFIQSEQHLPAVTVEYAAAQPTALTKVELDGRAVKVTPGTKARMVVSGVSAGGVNGTLLYAGLHEGADHWTSNGKAHAENFGVVTFVALYRSSGSWICRRFVPGSPASYNALAFSGAAYPDGLSYAAESAEGCVITAGTSNARQVRDTIEQDHPLRLLVNGNFTTNGTTPVSVPVLYPAGMINGRPSYSDTGSTTDAAWALLWQWQDPGYGWALVKTPLEAVWVSNQNVPTPDLVTAWVAASPATGVPDVSDITEGKKPNELLWVAFKQGDDGTGAVTVMPRQGLSGGVTGVAKVKLVTPVEALAGWKNAFVLPDDFVKLKTVTDVATGRKLDKFAVRRVAGRSCLLCDAERVSLEYVQHVDEPGVFDPLFVSAFTMLFAARLARAMSGSDEMEARFVQAYEQLMLPGARTASAQDTESNENHPLREFLDGNLTRTRGDFF